MTANSEVSNPMFSERSSVITPLMTMLVGVVLVVTLSKWLDQRNAVSKVTESEERLYLSGTTLKRISLGFDGLLSDWYWMRSLQYVGRKVIDGKHHQLDNLGSLQLNMLVPLLDNATTLDPQFMQPYEYAAVVLPDVDLKEAIRLTQKGIAANPTDWRLPQFLGYIYWQQGEFKTAADIYGHAAQLPYAPYWLAAMKAQMLAEGGSRDTARSIYNQMYLQSEEPLIREMAGKKLLQLQSLDERDLIRQIISNYSARIGHCPASFRDIAPALRETRLRFDSAGVPVDPTDYPYQLTANGCDVALDPHSEVPVNKHDDEATKISR
jgi:tetratricopeptide (TPR) repeat protein